MAVAGLTSTWTRLTEAFGTAGRTWVDATSFPAIQAGSIRPAIMRSTTRRDSLLATWLLATWQCGPWLAPNVRGDVATHNLSGLLTLMTGIGLNEWITPTRTLIADLEDNEIWPGADEHRASGLHTRRQEYLVTTPAPATLRSLRTACILGQGDVSVST
jgi:hypothetical protein